MLTRTDTRHAPWTIIRANDKRRSRLNVIRSVLARLSYAGKDHKAVGAIDDRIVLRAKDFLRKDGEE